MTNNDARAEKAREAVHFTFVPSRPANQADFFFDLDLPLDVVVYSEWTKSLFEVSMEIKNALVRQLEHSVELLLLQEGTERGIIIPTPFHFKLNSFGTLITVVYPFDATADNTASKEEALGEPPGFIF